MKSLESNLSLTDELYLMVVSGDDIETTSLSNNHLFIHGNDLTSDVITVMAPFISNKKVMSNMIDLAIYVTLFRGYT